MNLVDSSGWLEYFGDAENADFFAEPIEEVGSLLVPSICIAEVAKRVLQQREQDEMLQAVALMEQGRVVDLTSVTAMAAARISHDTRLPLADSIIVATAREHDAILWTQDADFADMAKVKYVAKLRSR